MTPIRPWPLLLVTVCAAGLGWLVIRLTYASFPPLPWTGVPALLLLAVAEAWSGRNVRARIQRRPGAKPLVPIAVARLAVLAKASALVAVIFGGLAGRRRGRVGARQEQEARRPPARPRRVTGRSRGYADPRRPVPARTGTR